MKSTARSHANIAFIKYWGKRDPQLNLPFNDSISMNLSECYTTCSVDFDQRMIQDRVVINREEAKGNKHLRVVSILDEVRKWARIRWKAEVTSQNNFPMSVGIASSASAFSALALAASKAARLELSRKELSILARLGSGSACRSVVDGFAYWKKGSSSQTSYAVQFAPVDHWDIRDIVVVVSKGEKEIGSTEGHAASLTSAYFQIRLKNLPERTRKMRAAILERDFEQFGCLLEEEAIDFHLIAMTSRPPAFYWNGGTIEIVSQIREWRREGLSAYYTMDAGPTVHVMCHARDVETLNERLKQSPWVIKTIVNRPANGAR